MTPRQYEQMRSVFLAVRDLPQAERGSFLAKACGSDASLRGEVESLLADEAAGQSFLSAGVIPTPDVSADIMAGAAATSAKHRVGAGSFSTIAEGRTDSTFLEGYELLSEIHRGGQGIVYKAMQRSTNRLVAIKVLPEGPLASDRQKHRFEREVTLAASLRHPNIVTIHDSGLTSGRYYYVMEYVHGKPLNDYLAANPLTVEQKLRLFSTICSALVHAHQYGVIHRDLKPGNILVDARGEPHVVDFGLAKTAPVAALRDGSPVTATSQFLGTLAYASPEQTLGAPDMVDARSDVYSLGVILFEMLTGQLPYRITSDIVSSLQTVRDAVPPRPSSLNRELNTELDTITLRALSKESDRRYQTVADLGADIERYLAGEPILARRDSITYMMHKRGTAMMRRHQIAMMAGVALVAILAMWVFAGDIFMFWQWPLREFERLATHTWAPAPTGSPYADIRLIAINDETVAMVEEMAAHDGFTDVSSAPERWRSLRRLHGRLMTRLAGASVKGLAWDLNLPEASPYNDDFISGIKALQAVNVNPVIAWGAWTMDQLPPELMAQEIYDTGVGWGCETIGRDPNVKWRPDLIVQRSESVQMLGLSLAAIAAARHPETAVPTANLDLSSETVELRYPSPGVPFAPSEKFRLTSVRPLTTVTEDDINYGLRVGDLVGEFIIDVPDDATMARIITPYHEAYFMDVAALKQRFGGKMILMADQRSEPTTSDWADAPDGRRVHCAWGHAAAMDQLHRDVVAVRYPRGLGYFMLLAAGAAVGVVAAHRVPLRFFSISWRLAAGLVAFIFVGLVVYRATTYLCSPVLPFTAMLAAFFGLIVVERLGGRATSEGQKRSTSWSSAHS